MRSLLVLLLFLSTTILSCKEKITQADSPSKEIPLGSKTIVIVHTNQLSDTMYLMPGDIIKNTLYSEEEVSKNFNKSNYNPGFINMILDPGDHVISFSKNKIRGLRDNLFDIEIVESWVHNNRIIACSMALDIDSMNHGCYHISDDSENKTFDILFTPFFGNILQELKSEK